MWRNVLTALFQNTTNIAKHKRQQLLPRDNLLTKWIVCHLQLNQVFSILFFMLLHVMDLTNIMVDL